MKKLGLAIKKVRLFSVTALHAIFAPFNRNLAALLKKNSCKQKRSGSLTDTLASLFLEKCSYNFQA